MTDGFTKHNINHSSASQINMWANAPDAWIAQKLFKQKFPGSPAMQSGIEVENAVIDVIAHGQSVEDATKAALKRYDEKFILDTHPQVDKRREPIPAMIEIAIGELAQYGQPEFAEDGGQKKVDITCEGERWSLPVIGYIDFHFPDHGLVVDLKTTLKAPSSMSDEHKRGGAIYKHHFGNQAVKYLYVTPKKAVWHDIEDHQTTLAEIKTILTRQERLLSLSDNAQDLASVVPVNAGSFYWSDASHIRKELYGI